MSVFKWNDSYSVNVTEMDDQHKKLVDLINQLHDAMLGRRAKEIQKGILDQLITYTKTHFTREEQLMQQHNYTGLPEQKIQHEKFVEKLRSWVRDYKDGRLTLSLDMMNFLKDWLLNHIQKVDKKYSDFFAQKGLK